MSGFEAASEDPQDGTVETSVALPEGSIVVRSIEVVQYLNEDGQVANYVRWQGTGDIVAELGMLEYAKFQLYTAREAEDD